jgi:hypothetical protein
LRAPLVFVAAALAAGALLTGSIAGTGSADWLTYGNGPARLGVGSTAPDLKSLKARWILQLPGAITAQPLVVHDEPGPGETSLFVATSNGTVASVASDGFVRWQVELGQLSSTCPQMDGYGVTGTPVIERATHTMYLVDGFGWMHALSLATGAEQPGWPLRVYDDPGAETVWGALALVGDAVYAPTGSLCNLPMEGKLIRVSLTDRTVSSWSAVEVAAGGGGGMWGWGGVTYSAADDTLFAATGPSYEGGTNTGKSFTQAAGYAQRLLEFDSSLALKASVHPTPYTDSPDNDMVGSPLVFDRPGCGQLVTAINKTGQLYAWHPNAIERPPLFVLQLAKYDDTNPVVSQSAWDPSTNTLLVTASGRAVGVRIDGSCHARIGFSHLFGPHRLLGSPTIAGGVAWLTNSPHASNYLVGLDVATGRIRYRAKLGGSSLVAPTVVDGDVYVGGFDLGYLTDAVPRAPRSILYGFGPPPARRALPTAPASKPDPVARHTSWVGVYGLRSVPGAVLASENSGRSWHPVFPLSADRVLRTSKLNALITVGGAPRACLCGMRVLWTTDGGVHWQPIGNAVAGSYVGGKTGLFWWRDADVFQVTPWPATHGPLKATKVFHAETGRIAAGAYANGVFYGVVGKHVGRRGWDTAPTFVHIDKDGQNSIPLPEVTGLVLVQSISVAGTTIDVIGRDFGLAHLDEPVVDWRSTDGGQSWAVTRAAS